MSGATMTGFMKEVAVGICRLEERALLTDKTVQRQVWRQGY